MNSKQLVKIPMCNVCGKTFTDRSSLRNHRNIHIGHKPYSCYLCEKQYFWSKSLAAHVRSHSVRVSYKCAVCGLSQSSKYRVMTHMMVHTGDKYYECDICRTTFSRIDSLTRHKRKKICTTSAKKRNANYNKMEPNSNIVTICVQPPMPPIRYYETLQPVQNQAPATNQQYYLGVQFTGA